MGSCVICGTEVDGKVCESHQEDVLFHFDGTSADELVVDRYYEGTVDGYADFGVFVDVADGVTGLLHRSEVPGRLESLDWDAGDTVYVQVTGVHENGNVDLGWSIRQSPAEFRHELVQEPAGDREVDGDGDDSTETDATAESGTAEPARTATPQGESTVSQESESPETSSAESEAPPEEDASTEAPSVSESATEPRESAGAVSVTSDDTPPDRVPVADLEASVGEAVTVEGEITEVRQTSGPTVFTLTDETDAVEAAAFVAPGERAYPEVDAGDVVRLVGEVERRRGSLQVETESLTRLDGEERGAVTDRIDAARAEAAAPPDVDLLIPNGPTRAAEDAIVDAATAIRRAVFEPRPIVIRHAATVDGYVGSAAIERAILPLVRENHDNADAVYHYVDRQPLDDGFYDMSQATRDVVDMLEAAERHDEPHPLFVLVDAGSTAESLDGFELLNVYGADCVVVDGGEDDDEIGETAHAVCTADTTAAALAADVGTHVNPEVQAELAHLPAISFWGGPPQPYADLAAEQGRDPEDISELREAVALAAYYHGHGGKRELVKDLLWEEHEDLAAYVASQFRAKLASELETAEPHLESRDVGGLELAVLDADAFTHRFDFPPTDLLLDAIHRDRVDAADGSVATLVVDEDVIRFRSTQRLSARDLAAEVAEAVPDAGVRARGATEGHLEFLKGERPAVVEATVQAIADRFSTA
ncbi:MAG: OB-fold nucleic acid binding domain-containing protein [Halobacteriaceae archaeon]